MSGLHSRKTALREFLSRRDLTGVRRWAATDRSPLRTLLSLTFDDQELIRWRAVEAVGPVAADKAGLNPDQVRDFVRRLFWLMNDESGGLSWHSPETIGEVLRHVPALIDNYAPLLPSFLRERPFERGTHLAIWRVAAVRPGAFRDATEQLHMSLDDPDPAVRAFAAKAILIIDPTQGPRIRMQLSGDEAGFNLYDFESGELRRTSVAGLVTCRDGADTNSERAA